MEQFCEEENCDNGRKNAKDVISSCPFCGSWPLLKTNGVGEYKYIVSCQCEDSRVGGRSIEGAVETWMMAIRIVKIYVMKQKREKI